MAAILEYNTGFNAFNALYSPNDEKRKGGISVKGDAGHALRFIPTPGRKKQTTAAAPAPAGHPVTPSETADDDQISEYDDADCPNEADDLDAVDGFTDEENEEDEVIRRSTRSGTRSGAGPSDA